MPGGISGIAFRLRALDSRGADPLWAENPGAGNPHARGLANLMVKIAEAPRRPVDKPYRTQSDASPAKCHGIYGNEA